MEGDEASVRFQTNTSSLNISDAFKWPSEAGQ